MNNDGWMNNGGRRGLRVSGSGGERRRGTHVALTIRAGALELRLLTFNYGADEKQSISP
jgi:hypothetical protein